jgi:leucine dehydrogenase
MCHGATINDATVNKIKAKIIAGAANNQLANEDVHGAILQERGILYAPDFLINAGGIINVYAELAHYDREEIMRRTENIYNTTLEILDYAVKGITTHHAALNIAQNRIDFKIENSKTSFCIINVGLQFSKFVENCGFYYYLYKIRR